MADSLDKIIDELLKTRSTGLLVFDVTLALMNGNPDADGNQRTFDDGRAWATDVSIKAKIRQLFADHKSIVFLDFCKLADIDPESYHVFESLTKGYDDKPDYKACKDAAMKLAEDDPDAFVDRYVDTKLFGCTALPKKKKPEETPEQKPNVTTPADGKGSAEGKPDADNTPEGEQAKGKGKGKAKGKAKGKGKQPPKEKKEKEKSQRHILPGVVTISPAVSIATVRPYAEPITKTACLEDDKDSTLAPQGKKFIRHAIFVARLTVNPHYAHRSRTRKKDIEVLKKALVAAFQATESAARPTQGVRLIHCYWADHRNSIGSFNEIDFWNALTPVKKGDPNEPSTSIKDYEFAKLEGLFNFPVTDVVADFWKEADKENEEIAKRNKEIEKKNTENNAQ